MLIKPTASLSTGTTVPPNHQQSESGPRHLITTVHLNGRWGRFRAHRAPTCSYPVEGGGISHRIRYAVLLRPAKMSFMKLFIPKTHLFPHTHRGPGQNPFVPTHTPGSRLKPICSHTHRGPGQVIRNLPGGLPRLHVVEIWLLCTQKQQVQAGG